ncbi:MarR family winged helix-turn-helix transcriptional regulator [Chitinophaga sp. Cy-1792]|uniref:MarR family winged helix-turn-helix transcriptional regulator n=1 Tax=Chitinophaga sp. Cy-1792 TaxID=2608339 RepID=UPI0014215903|nr:MarR family winged helix-turn-helix transcriptional regulator [Chitinophaga sp. Cy-1792]NIG54535.1 winged helix-turn-helix transcriptional regulator [Chitinophaga sp. Cy-1792]
MKVKQLTISSIRAFNRYYTKLLGLLNRHLLNSDYSLVEARIIYEIHTNGPLSASQMMSEIEIDKGYLSKVLKQFEHAGLISKQRAVEDARITLLSLTAKGAALFTKLNSASEMQIEMLIDKLTAEEQRQLVGHMQAIQQLLQ